MDPASPLVLLVNVLSVAFWGRLLVMFLRHVSRSETYFKRVACAEAKGDIASLQAVIEKLEADRDSLRTRLESVGAIVTREGFDLEREARAAGILDLDALLETPEAELGENQRIRLNEL